MSYNSTGYTPSHLKYNTFSVTHCYNHPHESGFYNCHKHKKDVKAENGIRNETADHVQRVIRVVRFDVKLVNSPTHFDDHVFEFCDDTDVNENENQYEEGGDNAECD